VKASSGLCSEKALSAVSTNSRARGKPAPSGLIQVPSYAIVNSGDDVRELRRGRERRGAVKDVALQAKDEAIDLSDRAVVIHRHVCVRFTLRPQNSKAPRPWRPSVRSSRNPHRG
jgi:hypothetical protein